MKNTQSLFYMKVSDKNFIRNFRNCNNRKRTICILRTIPRNINEKLALLFGCHSTLGMVYVKKVLFSKILEAIFVDDILVVIKRKRKKMVRKIS